MFFVTLSLLACAPALSPAPAPAADTGGPEASPEETTDSEGRTITTVRVDATDPERWVFFDLDTGEEAWGEDASGWDVAIQRYHFALSGGVIGSGLVSAAPLPGAVFDALTTAPPDGYAVDTPDSDQDGIPEYVLADWYDYDPETHILTPADIVYVIQTDAGYHRLEIRDYYNDAGTSGHPEFRWGAIGAPSQE